MQTGDSARFVYLLLLELVGAEGLEAAGGIVGGEAARRALEHGEDLGDGDRLLVRTRTDRVSKPYAACEVTRSELPIEEDGLQDRRSRSGDLRARRPWRWPSALCGRAGKVLTVDSATCGGSGALGRSNLSIGCGMAFFDFSRFRAVARAG